MPFPEKNQLLYFLDLYEQTKPARDNENLSHMVAHAITEKFTKNDEQINDCLIKIRKEIKSCRNELPEWIKLIDILRSEAYECQKGKWLEGESWLCETLNALASIIITHISREESYIKYFDSIKNDYQKAKHELEELVDATGTSNRDCLLQKKSDLEDTIQSCLNKLVPVGYSGNAVHYAHKTQALKEFLPLEPTQSQYEAYCKFLDETKSKQKDINFSLPPFLQRDYYLHIYKLRFQSYTHVSYQDFMKEPKTCLSTLNNPNNDKLKGSDQNRFFNAANVAITAVASASTGVYHIFSSRK